MVDPLIIIYVPIYIYIYIYIYIHTIPISKDYHSPYCQHKLTYKEITIYIRDFYLFELPRIPDKPELRPIRVLLYPCIRVYNKHSHNNRILHIHTIGLP